MLPVYEVQIKYHKPAYYDQLLGLEARLSLPGAVRVVFDYRVIDQKSGAALIEGTTRHAVVGQDGRPRRMTPEIRTLLERGHRIVRVRVGVGIDRGEVRLHLA